MLSEDSKHYMKRETAGVPAIDPRPFFRRPTAGALSFGGTFAARYTSFLRVKMVHGINDMHCWRVVPSDSTVPLQIDELRKNLMKSEIRIYDIRGEDGDIISSQSDCEDSCH